MRFETYLLMLFLLLFTGCQLNDPWVYETTWIEYEVLPRQSSTETRQSESGKKCDYTCCTEKWHVPGDVSVLRDGMVSATEKRYRCAAPKNGMVACRRKTAGDLWELQLTSHPGDTEMEIRLSSMPW